MSAWPEVKEPAWGDLTSSSSQPARPADPPPQKVVLGGQEISIDHLIQQFNQAHLQGNIGIASKPAVGGFDIMRLHSPSVEDLNEDFICGLCKKIVMNPQECSNSQCSALFCKTCIDHYELQVGTKKCKQCSAIQGDPSKAFRQPSKVILKLLMSYQIQCQFCKKAFPMRDVLVHEKLQCLNTRCANELCSVPLEPLPQESLVKLIIRKGTMEEQEKIACSKKCKKVARFGFILKHDNESAVLKAFESMLRKKITRRQQSSAAQTMNALAAGHLGRLSLGLPQNNRLISQRGNIHHNSTITSSSAQQKRGRTASQKDRVSNSSIPATQRVTHQRLLPGVPLIIKEEEKKYEEYDEEDQEVQNFQQALLMNCLLSSSDAFHDFAWDPDHSSKDIHFSKDCRHAFLSESNYYFRTVISNRPFSDGVHYWEIVADSRTEHELKVGVTTQQQFNVNSSFSDYEFGFAYYGLGQLRHNSNSVGIQFGKQFKKKGILGVCLNMNLGTLSFALDGEYMGVAFEDPQLRKGPIYAAISLLHIAGCTLIACLEKPGYFP